MKLLLLSSDVREVAELVDQLLPVGIRCAVRRNGNSQVGLWILQDTDFPRALKIVTARGATRPLPALGPAS